MEEAIISPKYNTKYLPVFHSIKHHAGALKLQYLVHSLYQADICVLSHSFQSCENTSRDKASGNKIVVFKLKW